MIWLHELKINSGLLPRILITIYRFGYFIHFKFKIPILQQLLYFIYRLFDLIFVKLLLNCDLLGSTKIGPGLKIYHPYGIVINDHAIIGKNLTIRSQVVIGDKGNGTFPTIGDNVDIGTGAKVIGGITIHDNTTIGANTVVTKSFPKGSTLVGIPAHNIAKSKN